MPFLYQLPFTPEFSRSELEQLSQLFHGVFRILHAVTNGSTVFVDLEVVTSFECLVTEEVDICILDSTEGFLRLKMLEAVRFVPTGGENIKGDLPADRIPLLKELVSIPRSRDRQAYVSPKSGNFSFKASMNLILMLFGKSNFSYSLRSWGLALRPTGETLIIPLLHR